MTPAIPTVALTAAVPAVVRTAAVPAVARTAAVPAVARTVENQAVVRTAAVPPVVIGPPVARAEAIGPAVAIGHAVAPSRSNKVVNVEANWRAFKVVAGGQARKPAGPRVEETVGVQGIRATKCLRLSHRPPKKKTGREEGKSKKGKEASSSIRSLFSHENRASAAHPPAELTRLIR